MNCEFCNKEFFILKQKNNHYRVCIEYKQMINDCENILTKEYLIEHYINNGESLKFISKQLGLKKTRLVKKKLKEFNIKERTLQEAKKQLHHIELSKKTSKEKYGYEFHVTAPDILEKRENTNIIKYGSKNPFGSSSIRMKIKEHNLNKYGSINPSSNIDVRKKVENTCIERYGVKNVFSNTLINQKAINTKINNNTLIPFISKKSQKIFWTVYNQLTEDDKKHCYFFELNKEYGRWNQNNEKYYYYDFVLTNKNKCIEFNGDYYHMNPSLYEEREFNKKVNLSAKDIWVKDKLKNDSIIEYNYDLLIIWENEYDTNQGETIKKIINFLYN